MSDRHELLADLMGFGPYTEMALTRDGTLVAKPRQARSGGFNAFIGPIRARDRSRTAQLWAELTESERTLVLRRLCAQGIEPERIGIVIHHQHHHHHQPIPLRGHPHGR